MIHLTLSIFDEILRHTLSLKLIQQMPCIIQAVLCYRNELISRNFFFRIENKGLAGNSKEVKKMLTGQVFIKTFDDVLLSIMSMFALIYSNWAVCIKDLLENFNGSGSQS